MYVCMYVCMHVCMYVSMNLYLLVTFHKLPYPSMQQSDVFSYLMTISKQHIASAFTHIIVHPSDLHSFKWQNNNNLFKLQP